ncbi:MAG: DUF4013 domain-containing protein [Candidatus Obscuribacterales bacterium]|nr:DUF4013 domain-containing protein [Cyanobacteria bacterium SZAS LIN-5]
MSTQQTGLDPNAAFRQFFADPDWRAKAGIGGIFSGGVLLLFFLGPLFYPLALCLCGLLTGYYLRVVRAKIADMQAPLPKWNDWLDLLISGIAWIAVTFGQSLIPISIATISMLYAIIGGQKFITGNMYTFWAATSIALVTFSAITISVVNTIIMANFAKREHMAAAFDVITVVKKLASSAHIFLQAWLLIVGIQWLGIVVPAVSVIGIALIPICGFIASCVGAILVAQAWRSAEPSGVSS